MQKKRIDIKSIPGSVKRAVLALLCAWIWLLYTIYYYYDRAFWLRFLMGGLVLFFCLLQFKRWSRVLVLFSNAMAILYCTVFAVAFYASGSSQQIVVVSAINVLLFSFSSYFFFLGTTSDFFKAQDNFIDD